MRRVNVLHVMNSFVDLSVSRVVSWLVENIGSRNISWHVGAVTSLGDMQDVFARLGCQVIDFAGDDASGPRRAIRSYVHEHGVQVVHTHTPRTIIDASVALRGVPGVKHLATKHTLYAPSDRRWGLAYTLLDRLTLYLPDVVIPVSKTMHDQIMSLPFVDRSKVVLIRNAIPVHDFRAADGPGAVRSELDLPADACVLGYAGRIDKVKRIDLLLKAFREVLMRRPEARLVIAGEGSLKTEMQALAETLGISYAVRWLGFSRNMPGLLAAIDVYVQSSVNEGLSLSILEAMAAEKAVVATSVGGTKEVIADGETGFLVPPGSSAALAAAVIATLDDPQRRAAVSRAAKAYVEAEFDFRRMVDRYEALYASVATSRLWV
jgi:glycosyltransferase involved in cell wall biosynthesis